jgi:hypothetical protein
MPEFFRVDGSGRRPVPVVRKRLAGRRFHRHSLAGTQWRNKSVLVQSLQEVVRGSASGALMRNTEQIRIAA